MTEVLPVPLAAIFRSRTPIYPHEAAAVALELCRQVSQRRRTPGVMTAISSSTVGIDPSGAVTMTGGVPGEDDQSVSLIGRLLLEMLDHGCGVADAVPPRLRGTAARAASSGSSFASLAHLAAALRRHGPDTGEASATRALFERWARPRSVPAIETPALAFEPIQAPGRPRRRSSRVRLVAAGIAILLLAATGLLVLFPPDEADPRLPVVPATAPRPAAPRREPGWELLGKPERALAPARDLRPATPGRRSGRGRTEPDIPAATPPDGAAAGR